MKATRRDLLKGTAGTVAIAAAGSVATMAAAVVRADPILSLEQQLWEADEAWTAASDTGDSDAAYETFKPLDERMRDAVPVSLEGLAAKLRYLKWHVGVASDDTAQKAAATALEGLEALIEGRQS